MAETTKTLDPQVKERLDKIDWDGVKTSFGISRETIEKNPRVAAQLVYGAVTDLIPFRLGGISGEISLRALPTPAESGDLWKVKGYTKQEPLKLEDYVASNGQKPAKQLFYYGERVYSEKALKSLLEQTSWVGSDGKKKFGYANASSGMAVSFAFKKRDKDGNVVMGADGQPEREEKKSYILSIHRETNQVIGIAVDKLKERLTNSKNGISMYGVKLTDEQVNQVANGRAVILNGCKNKEGQAFNVAVQFDVSQMNLVPVHPIALKEAQKMGADLGIGVKSEVKNEVKKTEKPAVKKTEKPAEAPEKKTRIKR